LGDVVARPKSHPGLSQPSAASATAATLITFPPSLDCELARFLLTYYGVTYEERRHVIIFSSFATLWHGATLLFPLAYNARYRLDTARRMIDYFDPLCPADRNLLLTGSDHTLVESDWTTFNATLGGATAVFAYYHLLPHREIMIDPLSEGAPNFEVCAVRWAYPIFSGLLSLLLRLSESSAAAALEQIKTIAQSVDERLADGRRYLVGDRFSLSDMAFAVALAPLVLPANNGAPLPPLGAMPATMQSLNAELRARPAGRFALRIYQDHRGATS
jgi:glutathione S-transferase